MASLHTKIIIFFFFFWVVGVTQASYHGGDDLVFQICNEGSMPSSTFKHNLNAAIQNLTSLSSFTRYALSTVGSGEDKVHAMFQCRGDQSSQGCMHCLAKATSFLPSQCPSSVASIIQLDACYLRYDNHTFTTPDFQFVESSCSLKSVNDSISLHAIQYVVGKVISLAPRYGGYAVARGSNDYVGIAQCLGYLSEKDCAQCLSNAASYNASSFDVCGSSQISKQVHLMSCYYRYENYDFLSS